MKILATGLVMLAAGVGLGYLMFGTAREEAVTPVESAELESLRGELQENADTLAELTATNSSLTATNDDLAAQVQQLQASLEAAVSSSSVANATAVEDKAGLALSFGEFNDLKELLNADWEKIGSSMLSLREGILKILEKAEAGEDVTKDFMALQEHNLPLISFALALNGKLPTHGRINGVFTHPLAQINMMSEMLSGAELGLTETQAAHLEKLGQQYERDWNAMDGSYGDSALALDKLLDEADLKRDLLTRIEEGLTPEQREIIFPEASRDMNMLDLFSPALMFSETGMAMVVSSEADLRTKLQQSASNFLGVTDADLQAHQHVFDTWVADVRGILQPIQGDDAMFYSLDQGLTAGRAQATAVAALADAFNLSEEKRQELLNNNTFHVPRLVAPTE